MCVNTHITYICTRTCMTYTDVPLFTEVNILFDARFTKIISSRLCYFIQIFYTFPSLAHSQIPCFSI